MDLDTLQSLLGWCLVINMGIYLVWVVTIFAAREWLVRKHEKWFGVEPERLRVTYFQFLAAFKIAIVFLNFAPWLAILIVNR